MKEKLTVSSLYSGRARLQRAKREANSERVCWGHLLRIRAKRAPKVRFSLWWVRVCVILVGEMKSFPRVIMAKRYCSYVKLLYNRIRSSLITLTRLGTKLSAMMKE